MGIKPGSLQGVLGSVFIPLRRVLFPLCLGTIPPLLNTGDPISVNMSGSGGLKMVVTITSILVVVVLAFIMLMVLKRRRREQRLKRLRGRWLSHTGHRGVDMSCHQL